MVASIIPVLAIVGRPNVGKSTLFNRLTASRDALVADEPGLTRDRQYGRARIEGRPVVVVDTGGMTDERHGIDTKILAQAEQALEEADAILFLVDGRAGPSAADDAIAARLRTLGKPLFLVVNKTEGLDAGVAAAEFHALGLGSPHAISSAHGSGVGRLMAGVNRILPAAEEEAAETEAGIRIAVVGRPNVGKSTLVNRIVGEERVVAHDMPGTTRDSIRVPFERRGRHYTLIDTAGVRRRSRVGESIEKFSIIKTLQSIEVAHVVVMLVDARDGVTEQDAHILGHVVDAGRGLIIAVNKWDGLEAHERQRVREELDRRLAFIDFAAIHFISALHGTGVGDLFGAAETAWASATRKLPTPVLTRQLQLAVEAHPPPTVRGRRIKLRYAHQGGTNPPAIIIHGTQTESLPGDYKRYLEHYFRRTFKLAGTPIRIEFKTGTNPYEGRRNKLTPRQEHKRKRMKKYLAKKR